MAGAPDGSSIPARCFQGLLRPVVRFALRRSMKLHDLIELMKITFVQVAAEELEQDQERSSVSRISAMTGVHRKDVTRIQESEEPFRPSESIIAKVMGHWQTAHHFTTKNGKPRVLSIEGRHSEFAKLVESVNGGNLSAYAVLFEMERIGIVERTETGAKLIWRDYAPAPAVEEALTMLSEDTEDLFTAVDENVFHRSDIPNLHLKTEFDEIPERAIPQIRQWLLEEGSKFHARARSFLAQFDRRSRSKSEKKYRVAYGSFSAVGLNETKQDDRSGRDRNDEDNV